ncbi:MAG: hypothetical protein Q8N99_08775 [Nanoarchaeota archaeon]|nr:hypothetical protein [Nanoarchaeota archaeon]
MNERILSIFENFDSNGNCCEKANDLACKISELGSVPRVRRVFHKNNTFVIILLLFVIIFVVKIMCSILQSRFVEKCLI